MHQCMRKQSNHVSCKECKQEVLGEDLRDHWNDLHGEKLREIDQWLGKWDDRVKEWERIVRKQEGKDYADKQD